jgi:hypothetical protein
MSADDRAESDPTSEEIQAMIEDTTTKFALLLATGNRKARRVADLLNADALRPGGPVLTYGGRLDQMHAVVQSEYHD